MAARRLQRTHRLGRPPGGRQHGSSIAGSNSRPWYRIKLIRGRGVITARLSSNSSGSNNRCVVPSVHPCRSRSSTCSSGAGRRHSARGGSPGRLAGSEDPAYIQKSALESQARTGSAQRATLARSAERSPERRTGPHLAPHEPATAERPELNPSSVRPGLSSAQSFGRTAGAPPPVRMPRAQSRARRPAISGARSSCGRRCGRAR